MKARTLFSICLISGLAAAAQTAPPSQKVAPDTAKSPFAKPASSPAKPAMTQAKPAAMPAKPATMVQKKASSPASKPVVKQAAVKSTAKPAGKRDPFLSPIREGGPMGPKCTSGKKCLAIDSIKLIGIVRAQTGPIALIGSSTTQFTYFLRESDPVFNGYVVKITADSVVFRENVVDRTGKMSTRDITRTVTAPPV